MTVIGAALMMAVIGGQVEEQVGGGLGFASLGCKVKGCRWQQLGLGRF